VLLVVIEHWLLCTSSFQPKTDELRQEKEQIWARTKNQSEGVKGIRETRRVINKSRGAKFLISLKYIYIYKQCEQSDQIILHRWNTMDL